MELDKFNELRNTIIKNTVKNILKLYTIKDIQGNVIPLKQLEEELLQTNKCVGVTNLNQCTKKTLPNEVYCSIHYKKNFVRDQEFEEFQEFEELVDTSNYRKQLIDNAFYFIDEKYNCIYNLDGKKVGIVRNEKYLLTDDPFILM